MIEISSGKPYNMSNKHKEQGSITVKDEQKIEEIIKHQEETAKTMVIKRRTHVLKAELTEIQPSSILFSALSLASNELARLQRMSMAGELVMQDFKKYSILINSMLKLSEETRQLEQQSYLEGKTESEQAKLFKQAIDVLTEEMDDD